jgi:hypothetical protein
MKEVLKGALKTEKKDLDKLDFHLKLTKDIINVLQENFDLSGLKDK